MNPLKTCLINAKRRAQSLILAGLVLGGIFGVIPSAQATLTAVNDSGGSALTATEDTQLTIAFTALTDNDTGAVGTKTIISVSGSGNGTTSINGSNVLFTPASNFSGSTSFTYTVQDSSTSETSVGTVTISVTAVSDTPTLSVQSATGDEDSSIPLNINANLVDFSETLTVTITGIPSGASFDNTSHDVPTITSGSATFSSSQLSGLSIKAPANSDADFTLSVTATSTDGSATAATTSPATSLAVTVNPVSDVPTLTVQNASGNEDTDIALSISASLTDSSETLKVVLSNIPNGVTLLDGTTTLTINNFSAELTASQLSNLKFRPPANNSGNFTLTVTASSQDGTAISASTQAVNLNVLVNPVNDAPTFSMPATAVTVNEDAGSQFLSNWATSISAGPEEFGQSVIFQLSVNASPTALFSAAPAISTEGHLTFAAAPNANGTATVTVTLKDNGGVANSGQDTSSSTQFTITVTAINDPPRLTAPQQQNVNEDTDLVFSSGNLNLISVTDPDAGSLVRLSLSAQSGKITLSHTDLTFLSTAGTTATPLTVNNSANIVVEGSLTALNSALAGAKYTPNAGFNGSDNLVVLVSDLFSGTGGALTHTASVGINVVAVNDPPTANDATFNVPENSPFGHVVGQVAATDPDAGSGLQFIITSGNTDGVFGINRDNGDIYVAGPLNFEGLNPATFTLAVLVSDNGQPSLSDPATITINVQDVNEPPRIERQMVNVNENTPNTTAIGTLVANDPDAGVNGNKTFSILSGNEDNKFALSAAGALSVTGNLDFESRNFYSLSVMVADGGTTSLSAVSFVEIKVNDVNEPPIIQAQSFTVDENVPPGTHVGGVLANDPDLNNRVSYSITAGDPNNKFRIDQVTGLITVQGSLDFEAPATSSYSLTVKATDNGNPVMDASATVTIQIRNLNEFPIITVPMANNAPAEQVVNEDTALPFSSAASRLIAIADDSGTEPIDVTLKVEHGMLALASVPTGLSFQSGANNTGRMRIRAAVAELNTALNGMQYTPMPHHHGGDFLEILVDDRGFAGAGGPQSRLTGIPLKILPVIDGAPMVRNVTVPFKTLSEEVIVIGSNPLDGQEVTHFQITDISGGQLFHHDGRTLINNGNFITWFEGAAGLRFMPTVITPPGSFKVKASLRDETSGLGGEFAEAAITVVKADQFITLAPVPGHKTFGEPAIPVSAMASSGLPVGFAVTGPANISGDIALSVSLKGAHERPNPVATPATGAGTGTLAGNQLTLNISYSGLSGTATAAHIHGPAGLDEAAGVMVDLGPLNGGSFGAAGVLSGNVTLTTDQVAAISTGQAYVNIHTAANSGGEIRGQLIPGKFITLTGAGNVTLTASQAGDDRYNPAPQVIHGIGVAKGTQQISFGPIPDKAYGDPDFLLPSAPQASSGLPVRLEIISGPAVLTIDPNTQQPDGKIRILGAGPVTVAAFQDGGDNYNPAVPVTQTFSVERAALNVTISPTTATRSFGQPNPVFDAPGFTVGMTGLKNQDAITVKYETTATPSSPIGNYPIAPLFQDPAGKLVNYNVNTTRGTLTVTENARPVAAAQQIAIDEDGVAAITLQGQDAEAAPLRFELVSLPQNGELISASGAPIGGGLATISPNISYVPRPNFNGTDSFQFKVNDGFRDSQPATISITVNPVNDPPTLGFLKNIGLRPSGPETPIPLVGIAAGPPNEQQTLSITATSSDTAKVTVVEVLYTSPSSAGVLVIQPVANAEGSANITVEVSDGGPTGAKVSRTFSATVTARGVRVLGTTAFAGSHVGLPVELVALGDENALGFSLAFDPAKLKFVSAIPGPTSDVPNGGSFQVNAIHADAGRLGIGLALPANQVFTAGTKRIATLNFEIPIEVPEGALAGVIFFPEPVPFEVIGVQANPLPAAFDGAVVTVTHGSEADVTPRPPELPDGAVSATDWVQVGRFAISLDPVANPGEFQRADCAPRASETTLLLGDGEIGIADWVQAGRYAAALDRQTDGTIPRGGGPSGTPQVITAQSRYSGSPGSALIPAEAQSRQIRVENRSIGAGQTFVVLVSMEAQGNENALGFSLKFDPEALSFVGARLANGVRAATLLTNDRRSQYGELGLALALPPGQSFSSGSRALAELEFASLASTPTAHSELRLTDFPVRKEVVSAAADELAASFAGATIAFSPTLPSPNGVQPAKGLGIVDRTSRGEFFLRLTGEPGQEFVIEASNDLGTWAPIKTVTLKNGTLEFVDSEAPGISARFYRHRLVLKSE